MAFTRHLALLPETSEITRFNVWLDKGFAQADVATSLAADFKLCLNEAVANIILYAFVTQSQPEPVISIEINLSCAKADAVLIDNGVAFNPTKWPGRPKISSLEDAGNGGFGIQLMFETADKLQYERVAGQNRLTIRCRSDADSKTSA